MMKGESLRNAIALVVLLSSALGLVFQGGVRLAKTDAAVDGLEKFRGTQMIINKDQDLRNFAVSEKLARVETMMEMVVRSMGMRPPPRGRDRQ